MISGVYLQSTIKNSCEALTLLQSANHFLNYLTVKATYGKTKLLSQA
jgi:hypothetical protein